MSDAGRIKVYVTSDEDKGERFMLAVEPTPGAVRAALDLHGVDWEIRHHPDRYTRMDGIFGEPAMMRNVADIWDPQFYDRDGVLLTPEAIIEQGGNTSKTPYRLVMD